MPELEMLARNVVDCWSNGNLALAVRSLQGHLNEEEAVRRKHAKEIAELREQYRGDSDREVDGHPEVRIGNAGIFVAVWHWVPIESDD
ncbi:hypothetical protein D8I35_03620 [Corticibacter populi]|uniref:Uncharacterized protein n=1 Tax=Corticibacter populi TaxID=1550736 RepID=A0A3M6R087_9BURK|nr:hypothetical protein [Corticibacter populi]RMX08212.1 hypothetical protein D8I35_03620 [Corticibacter populi]RZS35480.1 hypothetical protein EV687_0548 [Corticibacter populi]